MTVLTIMYLASDSWFNSHSSIFVSISCNNLTLYVLTLFNLVRLVFDFIKHVDGRSIASSDQWGMQHRSHKNEAADNGDALQCIDSDHRPGWTEVILFRAACLAVVALDFLHLESTLRNSGECSSFQTMISDSLHLYKGHFYTLHHELTILIYPCSK